MLDPLSDATNFIQAFDNKLKLRDFANMWMVENRVQDLISVTSGIILSITFL